MALRRLTLTRGDSQTYTLTFKQSGVLYCLKNCVVFFTLKTNPVLADHQASLQKIVTVFADTTSGTSGVAVVPITRADTISLDCREYDFDIKLLTAGTASHTVMKGKFNLEYNVTGTAGTAGTVA